MADAISCTRLTGAVHSVRLFKIEGVYLASSTMGDTECIKSRWDVGGYEWELNCYPKYWTTSGPQVALNLVFLGGDAATCNVKASLGCLLVHPTLDSSKEKRVSRVFKRPNDSTPLVLLVGTKSLPLPSCPRNDYLTMRCTVMVLKELPDIATTVPLPSSNLHQHLGELLRTSTGADITFLVSGESFALTRAYLLQGPLSSWPEFFGRMMETSAPHVVIEDMEAVAFRAMLHFIYTDMVPELDQELEAVAMMAQHLLAAADRYELDRLKVICEGKLACGITVETAATTLALAEQHNCSHLKAKCVDFIVSTPEILDAVVATEGYKHLEASCPSALTSIVISMRGRRN